MSDEQKVHLKPDGHAHGWYDPPCWPISDGVCLRPTVHGGVEHVMNADGSMAGGPVQHLAGFVIAHDRPDQRGLPRCEGAVNVDTDFESKARWMMTGSLEGGDLTLSPSILCGDGFHGYVRDGKWVNA